MVDILFLGLHICTTDRMPGRQLDGPLGPKLSFVSLRSRP